MGGNHVGAAIFWLYIVAALAFTAVILKTLYDTKSPKAARKRHVQLFVALAVLSFVSISYNMLHVLVSSYTIWAHDRGLSLADTSLASIWHWSITSTLFQDFGNAIVQNSARYFWVQMSLQATLRVCLLIGIEGQYYRIPRLWAFIGLGQILPSSFAQNLFYIALLRQGAPDSRWTVSRPAMILFSTAYCACLIVAPALAGSQWLIPHILLARGVLVVTQVYNWPQSAAWRQQGSTTDEAIANGALFDVDGFFDQLLLLGRLCGIAQAGLALFEHTPDEISRALFIHPAVSTLSVDFFVGSVSYFCWRSVRKSEMADASKKAE